MYLAVFVTRDYDRLFLGKAKQDKRKLACHIREALRSIADTTIADITAFESSEGALHRVTAGKIVIT